jgi:hypothetical protein
MPLYTAEFSATVDGIVGLTILAANTSQLTASSDDGRRYGGYDALPPDAVRRPIRIARVADSVRLPFETARRHVNRLILKGACVRSEDGVIVPASFVARMDPRTNANLGHVRKLVRALAAEGLLEAEAAANAADPTADDAVARLVSRSSAGYVLRLLQLLAEAYGDIRTGIIAQTIFSANVAHLQTRNGEGWRYAGIDQAPPDELRRPVSILSLADSLGVAYETMRGQAHRLIDAGICTQRDGGLIVPKKVLETPAAVEAMLSNVGYVRRLVREVRATGFDVAAPSPLRTAL